MINYQKILNKNLLNVLKEVLLEIKKNGLKNNNQLYITFKTNQKSVKIPDWLINKYPNEMTIVIQYEYYDLQIYDDYFLITLSFNDIKTNLQIGFNSIISFADPNFNFGLKFENFKKIKNDIKISKKESKEKKDNKKDNIINFVKYKNNYSK